MAQTTSSDLACQQYELEIDIDASRQRVWNAMLEETDAWWLPDFHMVGADSTVEFDTRPGGRGLIEHRPDGSFLVWYTVQFFQPEEMTVYLVGNVAPDWGGPSTSNLKLSVEPGATPGSCRLRVSDTHHGRVTAPYLESLQSGWRQLFGQGLADHVR